MRDPTELISCLCLVASQIPPFQSGKQDQKALGCGVIALILSDSASVVLAIFTFGVVPGS